MVVFHVTRGSHGCVEVNILLTDNCGIHHDLPPIGVKVPLKEAFGLFPYLKHVSSRRAWPTSFRQFHP